MAKFAPSFNRDLKRISEHRDKDIGDLIAVIDLAVKDFKESNDLLKRGHNMHRFSGRWIGRSECHAANAGDWLVVWGPEDGLAIFERTGSHDEIFRSH